MLSNTQKNLLFTLAYYQALGHPLTELETREQFLARFSKDQNLSFSEFLKNLETLKKQGKIIPKNGFLFLAGQKAEPFSRIRKQKISLEKIKKLKTWIRALAWLPYLRGAFITGTLAMKNCQKKSDWDVLLVMKKNRIWIGRLILSIFLEIFQKRRSDQKVTDRFCLNHFLSQDGLLLQEQNEFVASELSFAIPVLGKKEYRKLILKNQAWAKEFKPFFSFLFIQNSFTEFEPGVFTRSVQKFLEFVLEITAIGAFSNWLCKKLMIRKIQKNPKTSLPGADIRYSDQALIFLPCPQREKIKSQALEIFGRLV